MQFVKFNSVKESIITLVFIFLCLSENRAQTVILSKSVSDTAESNFGPNKKHFLHFYLGYGFVAGKNMSGSEINYGRSGGFTYGIRYKMKISGLSSFGFDIGYKGANYSLSQTAGKVFPDGTQHKSETLSCPSLELALYNRINFDIKRGNYMGKFLDIGIAYNRYFWITHVTNDDLPNGTEVEVTTTKLKYVEYNNYTVFARLGINKYIFTAGYRLMPLFKNAVYNEFPPFIIGMQLGFY